MMTLDGTGALESSMIQKVTDAFLLILALTLLIAGFPSALFGLFLTISEQDGMDGNVAFWFSFGGFLSVLCALGVRAYLRRRDGWV